MTAPKDELFKYRMDQAETTLKDAEGMLKFGMSSHSIVNRAYYAMFYAVLALFIKAGVELRSSKHSGVISLFDKHFVLSGKLDKSLSRSFHQLFDDRQEFDYKELVQVSSEDAANAVGLAEKFILTIKSHVEQIEN